VKRLLSSFLIVASLVTWIVACDFSSSNEHPDANQPEDTLSADNGADSADEDVPPPVDASDTGVDDVATTTAYTLHEWGVNTVKPGGSSTIGGGPEKLWESIDRKPVIYIYSDDQFVLDVAVEFNSGISTETWPIVPNAANVAWNNIQVGSTTCTTTATPQPDYTGGDIESLEIYDLPTWVVEDANCLTCGDTVSKLLFYTGTFQNYVPIMESSASVDTTTNKVSFSLTNTFSQPIGKVIALYRYAESTCYDPGYCPVHTADIAVTTVDSIAPGETKVVEAELFRLHKDVTDEDPYPSVVLPTESGWEDLPAELSQMLSDAGLTDDEIYVFREAWATVFFGLVGEDRKPEFPFYDSGAFLIYLWPDARTEQKVPMTLVPAPSEKIRAIVEYQQIETTSTPL
jgi:hypothetical protein